MCSPKLLIGIMVLLAASGTPAQDLYPVNGVEVQPLMAQAERLIQALTALGSPLASDDAKKIQAVSYAPHNEEAAQRIQAILDPYCLAMVHINPETRVKVLRGPAPAQLVQSGWSSFLVKVHNESGTKAALNAVSPQAEPALHISKEEAYPLDENLLTPGQVANRFVELAMYRARPLSSTLSGLTLEYQVVQIYTNAVGPREVQLSFNAGTGTEDLGFRNALHVLFECAPSVKVVFRVKDFDGAPTMASFVIQDQVNRLELNDGGFPKDYRNSLAQRRPWEEGDLPAKKLAGIYPLPSRRVAATDEYPDFFFQPQIYRADGEHVYLPPGEYQIDYTRGPEYLPKTKTITVPEGVKTHEVTFELERWTHLAKLGWYSADHHVHGGGCSHYESPEAGVNPESMFRQGLGEDLNVSCVLAWGPCWYHQKTFFEGDLNALSTKQNLIRYDVEVSGFPSSHAGHICLLRLSEDDYPGTTRIEEWPSWGLPVLEWGKSQGGVVGYAHSGLGLAPIEYTTDLPNYVLPRMDSIGANEYIVTVTHDAVDFISTVDTAAPFELNIWYHTLNCGFRTRISGETDYPCMYDDRVGMGRSYAPMEGDLNFDRYMQKIVEGANYVSDGKSHIIDFKVDDTTMGIDGSEVHLTAASTVKATARVTAYLPEKQDTIGAIIAASRLTDQPFWDIERARNGTSRTVTVELIVNGYPVAEREIEADGEFKELEFNYEIEQSSWVAVRVFPSSHTNPIFVLVNDKPIRASKRSAEWCIASVDRCWEMKESAIREEERPAARKAYDAARKTYEAVLAESVVD